MRVQHVENAAKVLIQAAGFSGTPVLTIGPEVVPQSLGGLTIDAGLSLEKGDLLDGSGLNAGITVAGRAGDALTAFRSAA